MVDRYKLRFGTYRTPRYRIGAKVDCLARGEVTIVGTSAGHIPWPIGKTARAKSLVLYGDLARAVRRESSLAVRHWWGVGASAVQKWRRVLGVASPNEGDRALLADYGHSPMGKRRLKAMHAKLGDPARAAAIAAAKRGKPRPPHVIEALRKANIGRKASEAARKRMSEDRKRRGVRPPKAGKVWADWEQRLLFTLPANEVAAKTGRTLSAVYSRRKIFRLPDDRRK